MADKREEPKLCCICRKRFIGFGNNPEPVRKYGVCCDECNYFKVIPARKEEAELDGISKNY